MPARHRKDHTGRSADAGPLPPRDLYKAGILTAEPQAAPPAPTDGPPEQYLHPAPPPGSEEAARDRVLDLLRTRRLHMTEFIPPARPDDPSLLQQELGGQQPASFVDGEVVVDRSSTAIARVGRGAR